MYILGERGMNRKKLEVRISLFFALPVFPGAILDRRRHPWFLVFFSRVISLESYSTASILGAQPHSSISLSHFSHP
jgi:hypothetical protein